MVQVGPQAGRKTGRRGPAARDVALAVPLVLINLMALWGQVGWADHVVHNRLVALGLGVALESAGIYLALESHHARLAGVAAAHLAAGSYVVGGVIAAVNYTHFAAAGFRPTTAALVFGGMSAGSPWLWQVRSRARHREQLLGLGLMDHSGVRLSMARKLLFPGRSFGVYRLAVWQSQRDPVEAVRAWEGSRATRRAIRAARLARLLRTGRPSLADDLPADPPVVVSQLPDPSRGALAGGSGEVAGRTPLFESLETASRPEPTPIAGLPAVVEPQAATEAPTTAGSSATAQPPNWVMSASGTQLPAQMSWPDSPAHPNSTG